MKEGVRDVGGVCVCETLNKQNWLIEIVHPLKRDWGEGEATRYIILKHKQILLTFPIKVHLFFITFKKYW